MGADKPKRENTFRNSSGQDLIKIEEESKKNAGKDKKSKAEKKAMKSAKQEKKKKERKSADGRIWKIVGILFILLAIFLAIALVSYFMSFYSGHHQEFGNQIFDQALKISNRTGRVGSWLGETLVKESFGIGAFFFVYLLALIGLRITVGTRIKMWNVWKYALLGLVWLPLFFAFVSMSAPKCAILGGAVGRWINLNLLNYIGKVGVILTLIFTFLIYAIYEFNITFKYFRNLREKREQKRLERIQQEGNTYYDTSAENDSEAEENEEDNTYTNPEENLDEEGRFPPVTSTIKDVEMEVANTEDDGHNPLENRFRSVVSETTPSNETPLTNPNVSAAINVGESDNKVELVIEKTQEEKTVEVNKETPIEHFTLDTPFDPRYELRDYKFPTLDMLKDYGDKKTGIDNEELEANKNKIVETLANYGIAIDKIKATIGPTVTLYEIVPAAGVRISKIKNLEDDIALSLAALGIRIIAPIPGKGTIGIEVPNSKPETVSMKSVLSSEKFQNSKFALPCAIGKTISNETYVFDLAKMPHILMAGATGMGKSVGLNAIIASLLYSKHPAELKFVMVDPKKVELTLFNKIERHYLAKLPDEADAIISDVKKVVRTLNSLCIEMDNRYDLLKAAECRNIIEYNEKFKSRRLLPTEGHHYLPYIVLIIDEFCDLIMTAGRDVEAPIARLAQLARAIGIHLIIATQRPSVNVITGSIKANFPARIAFRVISAVDSKTILDQSGANQLIGRGDMLVSTGNDLVRLQCAFIDTPEVKEITEFIGAQRGYSEAFPLPEVPEDDSSIGENDDDNGERDSLFEEAARIVVQTQQGSTSMIQRKLKLGYNRAGRIIDQLEAAGIVGPFSGSKSREVKVANEFALEQILQDIRNKDNGI